MTFVFTGEDIRVEWCGYNESYDTSMLGS